jgi:hypothetical protein
LRTRPITAFKLRAINRAAALSRLAIKKARLLAEVGLFCNSRELVEPPRCEERKELKEKSSRPLRLGGEKSSYQLATTTEVGLFANS